MKLCPCRKDTNVQKTLTECCGAYLSGEKIPATPEELMRSRYTAYTQSNIDYITKTMKGRAADNFNPSSALDWSGRIEWLQLVVMQSQAEGDTGQVEFIAYFKEHGKKHAMHELSTFKREDGRWFYVDGVDPGTLVNKFNAIKNRVGRNDACVCGSGKKYKKCCGGLA